MKDTTKPRIYVVTFDTSHNGERLTKNYVYHCTAHNAKEAVAACREKWIEINGENRKIRHQFHLHATRSIRQDPAFLRVVTWRSAVVNGTDCLDEIFCTGWTHWRKI